jgi:hypothetical protein
MGTPLSPSSHNTYFLFHPLEKSKLPKPMGNCLGPDSLGVRRVGSSNLPQHSITYPMLSLQADNQRTALLVKSNVADWFLTDTTRHGSRPGKVNERSFLEFDGIAILYASPNNGSCKWRWLWGGTLWSLRLTPRFQTRTISPDPFCTRSAFLAFLPDAVPIHLCQSALQFQGATPEAPRYHLRKPKLLSYFGDGDPRFVP